MEDEPDEEVPSPAEAEGKYPRWVFTALLVVSVLLFIAIAIAALALVTYDDPETAAAPAADVVIEDQFDRVLPDSLGVAKTGQAWTAAQGIWGVDGQAAIVSLPDGRLDSIAVVELGDADGRVQAVLRHVAQGAGVVVRFQDPSNYIAVVAQPQAGTWSVVQVQNGQHTDLGPVGTTPVDDPATIEVHTDGDTIDVFVDDVYADSFVLLNPVLGTKVGLIATETGVDADWGHFEAESAAHTDG